MAAILYAHDCSRGDGNWNTAENLLAWNEGIERNEILEKYRERKRYILLKTWVEIIYFQSLNPAIISVKYPSNAAEPDVEKFCHLLHRTLFQSSREIPRGGK